MASPGMGAPAAHAQVSGNAVEDGRLLYIQNCASCHGNAGEGSTQGNTVIPPLTNAGPAGLDFYMRTGRMPLARLGLPSYEQPPTLTQDQIAAVIQYASAFSQGPQIPTVTNGADLSRGWQMYVNNCAACHGAAADGGSVGAGIAAPSLHGRGEPARPRRNDDRRGDAHWTGRNAPVPVRSGRRGQRHLLHPFA